MAGSGKTTLIQRINAHMHMKKMNGYIINLDPAVTHLPYGANIDIRDTVSSPSGRPPTDSCHLYSNYHLQQQHQRPQ
jgi:GTPase SAR1 family protein